MIEPLSILAVFAARGGGPPTVAEGLFLLVFLVLVCYHAWLGWVIRKKARKRPAALQRWARSRQLSFCEDRDCSFGSQYRLACLAEGGLQYACNIMDGMIQGHLVRAFDYHYFVYVSKGSVVEHCFSAVLIATDLPVKPLLIRGKTSSERVKHLFAGGDIALESAEFNGQFHVTSPDRRWAFDVLPQSTMEFLLESPRFSLEIQDGRVLVYPDVERPFSPDEFQAAMDVVLGFWDRIPPSVLQELEKAS